MLADRTASFTNGCSSDKPVLHFFLWRLDVFLPIRCVYLPFNLFSNLPDSWTSKASPSWRQAHFASLCSRAHGVEREMLPRAWVFSLELQSSTRDRLHDRHRRYSLGWWQQHHTPSSNPTLPRTSDPGRQADPSLTYPKSSLSHKWRKLDTKHVSQSFLSQLQQHTAWQTCDPATHR